MNELAYCELEYVNACLGINKKLQEATVEFEDHRNKENRIFYNKFLTLTFNPLRAFVYKLCQ